LRRRFPFIVPILLALAVLFLGSLLLGRNAPRPYTNNQGKNLVGQNIRGTNPYNRLNNVMSTPGIFTTPSPGTRITGIGQQLNQKYNFNMSKARNITNQLGNIVGLNQINTIVNGDTAIIGYSPSPNAVNANNTRNTIINRVKQMDGSIKNVIVSDSADLSNRIRTLVDKINKNHPVTDINNDFNQLMQNLRTIGK
jgi:Sporulation lipoprotein YhcN/YlaJ (Spore_YhcN_YlaJ).